MLPDIPEFMARVQLPSSGAYHSSPSGDSEYEDAYDKAMCHVVPPGFEVVKLRLNEKWPVDSAGWTWVRLRCMQDDPQAMQVALQHWMDRARKAEDHLIRIKEAVTAIETRVK